MRPFAFQFKAMGEAESIAHFGKDEGVLIRQLDPILPNPSIRKNETDGVGSCLGKR